MINQNIVVSYKMTTDIIDNSYKDPSYEIQKTMAIGAQTFINLLS